MSNCRTALVLVATVLAGCAHTTRSEQPAPAGQVAPSDQRIAERFLRAFDEAVANKDLEAYTNLLDDNVTNNVTATRQGGAPQTVSATKPQMIQAFTQLKGLMSGYQIERKDIQVSRQGNGDLLVKDSYTEHMTLGTVRVTTESREEITLVADGDAARAKAFDTTSTVTMAPAQAR